MKILIIAILAMLLVPIAFASYIDQDCWRLLDDYQKKVNDNSAQVYNFTAGLLEQQNGEKGIQTINIAPPTVSVAPATPVAPQVNVTIQNILPDNKQSFQSLSIVLWIIIAVLSINILCSIIIIAELKQMNKF
jgi:hypothetical protein